MTLAGDFNRHHYSAYHPRPSMYGLTLSRDARRLSIRPFKAPGRKDFDPQPGEVGAWYADEDGERWQVWAEARLRDYVWVVNGREFREVPTSTVAQRCDAAAEQRVSA